MTRALREKLLFWAAVLLALQLAGRVEAATRKVSKGHAATKRVKPRPVARPPGPPTSPPAKPPAPAESALPSRDTTAPKIAPAPGQEPPAAEPPKALRGGVDAPVLVLGVDGAFDYRVFDHIDGVFGGRRRYAARGIPGLAAVVALYPFASSSPRSGPGLSFRGVWAFPFESRHRVQPSVPTQSFSYELAFHWRWAFENAQLSPFVAFARSVYDLEVPDRPDVLVPRGRYGMVRLGGEGRLRIFGPLELGARLAYWHVVSIGKISSYSPLHARSALPPAGKGFDAAGIVALHIAERLWVEGSAASGWLGYDADTTPVRSGQTATVTEQYLWLHLGPRIAF